MSLGRSRSIRVLGLATFVLISALAGINLFFLNNTHENALQAAETSLARHTLTQALQADGSFKSLDLVLSSIGDYLGRREVTDSVSYRQVMSDKDTYFILKEKIAGLPYVDAVTLIDAQGKLINFSRYWPTPDVNVSDRDYFQALRSNPNLETFISVPVRNRGDGKWNIYVARRLNDPDGAFMGLILGALSVQYFENFFATTSLGSGTTVSLEREDGALLAHYPPLNMKTAAAPSSAGARALAAGGIVRDLDRGQGEMQIRSARMLPNYPMMVVGSQTESSALTNWRSMASLLGTMVLVSGSLVLLAALSVGFWWRRQERLIATTETAKEAALAANKAKSTFLATMSHEIRTPMNAVLGLTSSLLETNLEADQRSSLLSIHDAGDNLLSILNDILDFSKLEAGQLDLEQIAFSPEVVVENVLSIIAPHAMAKGLKVRIAVETAMPAAVVGDAGRIRQVLLNLSSNAVKFTSSGEIAITVKMLSNGDGQATIEWAVTDTGMGIAPEQIGALFNEFVQADSSINRRFGGSGLGLSICKRLVERMGGEINVTSTLGQGSHFSFYLTLPTAEGVALPELGDKAVYAAFKSKLDMLQRPLRILIVDDNETNRLVAAKMLREFNIKTSIACDGVEAVDAAKTASLDLILMDVQMPNLNGMQATQAIRACGGDLTTLPIIAMTANAFADDVQACRDAGMDDFVAKPVRKRLLVEAMLRSLSQLPWQRESAADVSIVPPMQAPPSPVTCEAELDPTAFKTLVDEVGEETAFEVFEIFVMETKQRLPKLRGLLAGDDRKTIEREAHSLKSTSATFGFTAVARLAREVERSAGELSVEELSSRFDQLDVAFRAAEQRFSVEMSPGQEGAGHA